MHDPLDYIQQLAAKARDEHPPTGHPAPAVLARLQTATPSLDRPLTLFAMIAATAAAATVLMAFYLVQYTPTDTLGSFFDVASITF